LAIARTATDAGLSKANTRKQEKIYLTARFTGAPFGISPTRQFARCVNPLTVRLGRTRHHLRSRMFNQFTREIDMSKYSGSGSWRQSLSDLFAACVFTAVILLVVGGTTAMVLGPSVVIA